MTAIPVYQGSNFTPTEIAARTRLHELANQVIALVQTEKLVLNKSKVVGDWLFLAGEKFFSVITPTTMGRANEVTQEEDKITWGSNSEDIPTLTKTLEEWIENP